MTLKILFALSAGYWLGMNATEWLVVIAAVPVVWFFIWKFRELRERAIAQQEIDRLNFLRKAAATSYRPVLVRGGKR